MTSGLYSYTNPPTNGACWVCGRDIHNTDRHGKIPALCGPSCDATWRATYGLDIATHTAGESEWAPLVPTPQPASAPPGLPGSWLRNPFRD